MMKTGMIKAAMSLAFVCVATTALADDTISVTVNGKTYSCNSGSQGNEKFGCECVDAQYSWQVDVTLNYISANVATGKKTVLRTIETFQSGGGNVEELRAKNRAACHEAFRFNVLCRN